MKKYIEKPFDIELAKAIIEGKMVGEVCMRCGHPVRLICLDAKMQDTPVISLKETAEVLDDSLPVQQRQMVVQEDLNFHRADGRIESPLLKEGHEYDLYLMVLEEVGGRETPKLPYQDLLLVRNTTLEEWKIAYRYEQVLPYEGNEHLHGTTDSPDEDVVAVEV